VGLKILLADDSVTAQNMGKKILSEAGHDVVTVSNGAAAAKKIAEVKPELVLLDVFMPGYSGLELCERLRNAAETAKLPVLLTVGRMEPYSPQDGARVKADGVIVKPFEATDLTAAVERFAQKSKEGKQPGDYEKTIRIAPPPGSRDDTNRESQKIAVSGSGEPRAYEQTMRLDPAQIAALLNTTAAKPEKPSVPEQEFNIPTAASPAVEEFGTPRPPRPEIPLAQAAAPAMGSDLLPTAQPSTPQPAPIPSYMAQYLDQSADDAESAVTARPAVGPSAEFDVEKRVVVPPHHKASTPATEFAVHEQLSPTIPISNEILSHRFPGDINPPPVASAEGLELTSVAPVPDAPVAQEGGLETTIQSAETPTIILKDPALVTDPHHATMDFPTQFGTDEPTIPDLTAPTEAPTASVDEFEARLNAAMSSYEEPSTDLPLPSPIDTSSGLRAELVTELPSPAEVHAGMVSELPSPTEPELEVVSELPSSSGAIAAFDETDEPFFATAPIGSSELALPEPVVQPEVTHELVPSNVVEFPSSAFNAPTAIEHPQHEIVIEEAKPEIAVDAIAASTQSADSSGSSENADVVPMAMAAVAAASAPVVAPGHPNYEAEAELARALKAAMGAEADSGSTSFAVEDVERAPSGEDANRLAAAVEKVMHRELPGLIWKIMAELDIRKR
jgi:CheY-like chemotaxis protein